MKWNAQLVAKYIMVSKTEGAAGEDAGKASWVRGVDR
jgi:hypothetical protein